MALSGNDALKPGIHVQFCYTPTQADIKCVTHCSAKRFVTLDASSNVAIWVRQCFVLAIIVMIEAKEDRKVFAFDCRVLPP